MRYVAQTAGLKASTRANLLAVLRQFSRYLHAIKPESAVLAQQVLPRKARVIRFYPLTPSQVGSLMDDAKILQPENALRMHVIRFLIGLLYSTGLRIGEALALNLQDVDMERATLFVGRGKFGKERIVPMSSSTLDAMKRWLKKRSCCGGRHANAPLLIEQRNQRLTYNQAAHSFRRLCVYGGLDRAPPPRLHDLRHNFATRNLAIWRATGQNVDALLPVLANVMGHVDFFATQIYLHVNANGLQQASAKLNNHVNHLLENLK